MRAKQIVVCTDRFFWGCVLRMKLTAPINIAELYTMGNPMIGTAWKLKRNANVGPKPRQNNNQPKLCITAETRA
jgi:hypothetical protein